MTYPVWKTARKQDRSIIDMSGAIIGERRLVKGELLYIFLPVQHQSK